MHLDFALLSISVPLTTTSGYRFWERILTFLEGFAISVNFDNIQLQNYAEPVTIKTTATFSQSLDSEYLCSFISLQMVKCYTRYYTLDSLYIFTKLNELLNGANSNF